MSSISTSFVENTGMGVRNEQKNSIWGNWWASIRKWVYPTWLLYELSYRFYQYGIATYTYIEEIANQTLAAFSALVTFIICTLFLTVHAYFILYNFFKTENLTNTSFEEKIKKYF